MCTNTTHTGRIHAGAASLLLAMALPGLATAQEAPTPSEHHPACDAPAFHAFDFWPGEWVVESRMRIPDGWHESTERWSAEKRAGGCILVDYAEGDFGPTPMSGMGTRYYDPEADHWVITWLSTRAPGRVGRWTGGFDEAGVGDFFSEGEGPVRSRIRWTDVSAGGAHWEYAVSRDGGGSWTPQWIMEFSRAPAAGGER